MRQTEPLPGFALMRPLCGDQMRIIAFITDPPILCDILHHTGEPTAPPRIAPARGPPLQDLPDATTGDADPHAQPAPEVESTRKTTRPGSGSARAASLNRGSADAAGNPIEACGALGPV
ncbi:MAG: hypothetical protein KA200_05845 [Burkholderiales bacterium]|nr:hypothetical protein [Burkholderiales bacterium]